MFHVFSLFDAANIAIFLETAKLLKHKKIRTAETIRIKIKESATPR